MIYSVPIEECVRYENGAFLRVNEMSICVFAAGHDDGGYAAAAGPDVRAGCTPAAGRAASVRRLPRDSPHPARLLLPPPREGGAAKVSGSLVDGRATPASLLLRYSTQSRQLLLYLVWKTVHNIVWCL